MDRSSSESDQLWRVRAPGVLLTSRGFLRILIEVQADGFADSRIRADDIDPDRSSFLHRVWRCESEVAP